MLSGKVLLSLREYINNSSNDSVLFPGKVTQASHSLILESAVFFLPVVLFENMAVFFQLKSTILGIIWGVASFGKNKAFFFVRNR